MKGVTGIREQVKRKSEQKQERMLVEMVMFSCNCYCIFRSHHHHDHHAFWHLFGIMSSFFLSVGRKLSLNTIINF